MRKLKRLIAACLIVVCAISIMPTTNVSAATKTKAQIKKLCEKRYAKEVASYESSIKDGDAYLYDINKDGIKELIINDRSSAAYSEMYSIVIAYNKKKGKFVKTELDNLFWGTGKGYVCCRGIYGDEIYKMGSDGKLKMVASYWYDSYTGDDYYYVNGKKTTQEKYNKIYKKITNKDPYKDLEPYKVFKKED